VSNLKISGKVYKHYGQTRSYEGTTGQAAKNAVLPKVQIKPEIRQGQKLATMRKLQEKLQNKRRHPCLAPLRV